MIFYSRYTRNGEWSKLEVVYATRAKPGALERDSLHQEVVLVPRFGDGDGGRQKQWECSPTIVLPRTHTFGMKAVEIEIVILLFTKINDQICIVLGRLSTYGTA
jgi:hypothetical protein